MPTVAVYTRRLGALFLAGAVAQHLLSTGVSPYAMLAIGLVLLVFAGHLIKFSLIAIVEAGVWYHGQRLPGYQKVPGFLAWVRFQLTATPEDRTQRAENKRRRNEYEATINRQAELRERHKDMEYTQSDIAAFFDKYSVEVACLVPVSDEPLPVRSRIGGVPKLQTPSEWPRSGKTDLPLHFLAELHLDEVPQMTETEGPPKSGVLMFFCDLAGESWSSPVVVFKTCADEMPTVIDDLPEINAYLRDRTTRPAELDMRLMPEFAVRPVPRRVLRPTSELPEDVDRKLIGLARRRGETVFAEYVSQQPDLFLSDKHYNYFTIGGSASEVPNPTGGRGFKLLQLDSDTGMGLMIGDCGVLEFWIDRNDLTARRFENVRWALASA